MSIQPADAEVADSTAMAMDENTNQDVQDNRKTGAARERLSVTTEQPQTQQSEESNDEGPLRVLVFDLQSAYSRLFSKQLSHHLRLGQINHPYVLAATLGPQRIHTKLGNAATKQLWEGRVKAAPPRVASLTYEAATNKLLRDADNLERQGKTLFVTEYAPFIMKHEIMLSAMGSNETIVSKQSNPTILPDELLKLFTPIVFIQHPAVVIPAWLRLAEEEYGSFAVDDEDFTVWTSLRWSRMLFDCLRNIQHQKRVDSAGTPSPTRFEPGIVSTRPCVIDAEDVANNPHGTLAAVCRALGVEFESVSSSWTEYFNRATEALKKAIPNTFLNSFSSNMVSSQGQKIDLDVETKKWEKEFGDETAQVLRQKVEEDLPHYEFLKKFKLQIQPSPTTAAFVQNLTGRHARRQSLEPTSATSEANFGGAALRTIKTAIDGGERRRGSSV